MWENVPADISAQSDQRLHCPHEQTLHPWLSKTCAQWRFWSNRANAQADLNLCWVRMSEGTFSDVVTQISLMSQKLAEKYTTDSHPIDKGFWECVKLARDSQLGISILPKHNPVPLLYYYRIPNSILQTPSQFTNYKIACSPSQDSDQLHVRLVWSESL